MTDTVLVTGAAGYLGASLVATLAQRAPGSVVAVDLNETSTSERLPGVEYIKSDIRSSGFRECVRRTAPAVVVHLASIVTPGPDDDRAHEYSVDVEGSANVLEACRESGVRRIVVASSGAAYGYHADNPLRLTEDAPLRGNESFAYAYHKRLVEEKLARWRVEFPSLEQVVFRIGTILGARANNQITALFEKPRLIAVRRSESPFVFVWDQDVVGCLERAIGPGPAGVFNVAGDGTLSIHEIAALLGKPCVELPAALLRASLSLLKPLGLTRYGPEQVGFLQYRPVLDNSRLKQVFGYTPRLSSREAFEQWRRVRYPRAT